jgi:hypothetical protein
MAVTQQVSCAMVVKGPWHARGCSFEHWLINEDTNDAGSHHAERARRSHRYTDDPAPHERTTIINPALYRASGVTVTMLPKGRVRSFQCCGPGRRKRKRGRTRLRMRKQLGEEKEKSTRFDTRRAPTKRTK